MSILPQLRSDVKAEAVSDEARGAFYVMKSADGSRAHELSQTAYMTLCMLKGETEFESWMEQVQQVYPMVEKHHLEDLLGHMQRNDFLVGVEPALPIAEELSMDDEPPAPPALERTADPSADFLAGPSTPRPEVTGVTRPPPEPDLTFEAPPVTAPGAAASVPGGAAPAADREPAIEPKTSVPPKKMDHATASFFDNLDVEKTDPGRTGLLTTVDNQTSAPEPGLTLNMEDVPDLSDEADFLSIADDEEPPEPPDLDAAFDAIDPTGAPPSFAAPETSGFDLGEILDAQSSAAHAPFPEPENPLVVDNAAGETLASGSADDPIALPGSGKMSAAPGPQSAAATVVPSLGARIFANVVVEKSAHDGLHRVTPPQQKQGTLAQGVAQSVLLFEFELTLARLLDGSRNVVAVQGAVEKLGFPLSAAQVEHFALTLHSFGLLESLGDVAASENQPLLPWKNGPQLQSNVHDWLQEEQGLFLAALQHFRHDNVDAAKKEVEALLQVNPERVESNALKEMLASLSSDVVEKKPTNSAEFEPPPLTNNEFFEPRPDGVMPGDSLTPPPVKRGGGLVKVLLFAAALVVAALGGGMLVERETDASFTVAMQAIPRVQVKAEFKAVIASVEVKVGQDVKKDDVLVRFVEPPADAEEKTAALEADVAFYKKLSDGKEGKRLRISIYRAKLKAKKERKSAKTKYRVVEKSTKRFDGNLHKMLEKKSKLQGKQKKASTEKKKAYYAKLLKKLDKKMRSANKKIGVAQAKLAKYSEAQTVAEEKLEKLSGDLAAAQKNAEQKLKSHMAMLAGGNVAPLLAPVAGTVSELPQKVGAQVGPGQVLVSLGGKNGFFFSPPSTTALLKGDVFHCGDFEFKVVSSNSTKVEIEGAGKEGDLKCQVKGARQPWTLWLLSKVTGS